MGCGLGDHPEHIRLHQPHFAAGSSGKVADQFVWRSPAPASEIIYEINRRFLDEVRLKYPSDTSRIARMSLIDETGERYVRMAYLATVGGHAVNGVAELHSKLLKETTLHDFYELWPEKFLNVTNGVTPRRFVVASNPRLSSLVTRTIGDS